MDVNSFGNLPHQGQEGDQDQRGGGFLAGLSIHFLVTIHILIQVLVNLLQVRYQNSVSSPFETHQIIMSFFTGVVCVHFLALMELFRPIPNASCRHVARLICYISGVLACACLVLIIFPAFGWAILPLFSIRILLDLYNPQIIELLDTIYFRLFNIYDSIQQYFNIPNNLQAESSSPTVDGNVSMEQEEGGGHEQVPEV